MEDPGKTAAQDAPDPAGQAEDVHVVDAEGGQAAIDAASRQQRESSPAADQEAAATVEAILFASDAPLTLAKIAQVAELPGRAAKKAVEDLNARYEQMGAAFRIEAIAGGYQMLTRPEYHDVLSRLLRARSETRLTQAAMETLAIVAYRQPVLRADVEAIRGVACGEVLRGLMEKQLVKIVARAEILGRPMLYGTTRRFLEVFGLASLDDLPRVEELRAGAKDAPKEDGATVEANMPANSAGMAPSGDPAGNSELNMPANSAGMAPEKGMAPGTDTATAPDSAPPNETG
jgi:segregation and condensation protein B